MSDDDFYGLEIVIMPDGSLVETRRGGYEPRPLTESQLLPWLTLARQTLERDGLWPADETPCIVA